MNMTASKVKSVLSKAGVTPFKVRRQRNGIFLAEFRRKEGEDLESAEKLARDVLFNVSGGKLVAKHEWFRDHLPGSPRSVVLIEFRVNTQTAAA